MKISAETIYTVELSTMELSTMIDVLEDWTSGRLSNRESFEPGSATRTTASDLYLALSDGYRYTGSQSG